MNFDKTYTWFPILMWFCIEEVLKLTNMTKMGRTTKIMYGRWKFIQKLKNELDFIWKDFHSRSWRNKSHSIPRCISWDSIENNFSQSMMKKFVSWCSMKEKLGRLVKKWFVFWKWCEKFKFSYFEKFSHYTKFDDMKNSWNSTKILSTLKNLKQTLTLNLSSCSPKLKSTNEAYGVEN